jgi:non-heme chloroperoxidase
MSVFDGIRAGLVADRSQFYKDVSAPFYGANKPDAKVPQGLPSMIRMATRGSSRKSRSERRAANE